ncbi:ImmA/IrrE family metallo-endopeptidase [Acinetobacter soli]|uniref:ImmA/IrrE family metallo-endopeptidase n=1 Tax=Acinetobacter soli TaxID=487316 RepID=UPI001C49366F|nr:ImmA/IrrE family metallo-endopeptidase [Acinetobacter soli]MBV6552310.1 ImmA/IrrE family metallo-endopeptidase [Acinetobacter soli]
MSLELESIGCHSSNSVEIFNEFENFYSYYFQMPNNIKKKIGINDENYYKFFNIYRNSPSKSLFKKTDSADQYLIDFWVSTVSGKARFLDDFLDKPYVGINRDFLREFFDNFIKETNLTGIQNHLLEQGIYLIFESAKEGTKVDGVSLKVNEKPVVAMSLRLKNLDSFWFTLLHELSHIVLHFEELDEPIVDYFEESSDVDINRLEKQANKLAREIMIPNSIWRTIKTTRNLEDLASYSKLFKVHPSIIAGRLSFENNDWTSYSKLRAEYKIDYEF